MRKLPAPARAQSARFHKTSAPAPLENRIPAAQRVRAALIAATFLTAFSAHGKHYVTDDTTPNFDIGYGGTGALTLEEGESITLVPGASIVHRVRVGQRDDEQDQPGDGTLILDGGSILVDDTNGPSSNTRFNIGWGTGSTGSVEHHGGSVTLGDGAFQIGIDSGAGTYDLNGGSISLGRGSTTNIGHGSGGVGILTISNDATFTRGTAETQVTGGFTVGSTGGTGAIVQNGADSTVSIVGGPLRFGWGAGSKGSYELAAGSLTMLSSVGIVLGEDVGSEGTFTQTGGTSEFLYSAAGHPTLRVGKGGTGVFTVSGGTATVGKNILLADGENASGTLNVTGTGVLEIGGTDAIRAGAGTAVFNLGGGTLRVINSDLTTSVAPELVDGTTSTIQTNSFNATLSSGFTGNGGFAKQGAGALILGGNSILVGDSSVEEGHLVISGPEAANSALTINDGTTLEVKGTESYLTVGQGAGQAGTLNLDGGTIHINTSTGPNNFYVGSDGGTGSVTMTGGLIDAAATTSYTRIVIGYGGGTATFDQQGGTVTGAGGSFYLGSTSGATGTYTLSNDAVLDLGITTYIGRNTGTGTLEVNDNASVNMLAGDIGLRVGIGGGTGTIHQKGAGSHVNLAHPGRIYFGSTDAGSTGTYLLEDGTFTVDYGGDFAAGITFGEGAGTVGTFEQRGGTASFLRKDVYVGNEGTGYFILEKGTSTVANGLVLASAADGVGTLNLRGGTLEIGGGTNGIRKGEGAAYVNLAGGTLSAVSKNLTSSLDMTLEEETTSTILTDEANASLSGVLSGDGNLKKEGAGSLTLAGANTYTGTTIVTAGTLVIAGSGSTGTGAVMIGTDATLAGTGRVEGATTVYGALNPGNSPGNLTFAAGLTLAESSVTTLEIAGSGAGQFDTLSIETGVLTLGGTLTLNITSTFDLPLSLNLLDLGSATVIDNFTAVLLTGVYGNHGFNAQEGNYWTLNLNGRTYTFDASSGALEVAAIPEPGTWALLIAGIAGLWMLRRRKVTGLS